MLWCVVYFYCICCELIDCIPKMSQKQTLRSSGIFIHQLASTHGLPQSKRGAAPVSCVHGFLSNEHKHFKLLRYNMNQLNTFTSVYNRN